MSNTKDIHPDVVFESLLLKGGRSNRRTNLAKVHEVCRKVHAAGSRDFSLSAIGRLVETEGIMKGRALYNAQSADYRALIQAWAAYAGPAVLKPPKTLASHEYLWRIEDPAIRSIMQSIIAERDKLKAQLNVLKSHTQVTVDRRPMRSTATAAGTPEVTVLAPAEQLTPMERKALQKAVSAEYLDERGLREGSHGEIVNERGRVILEVGFVRAIRKLLGSSSKEESADAAAGA